MKTILMVLIAIAVVSCARVEVRPVKDARGHDQYTDGVRFYRPDLYLLITEDADHKIKGQIVALPDKNQEYFVRTTAGIGSVEANVTLADGWNLTGLDASADSKASEMLTALAAFGTMAGALNNREAKGEKKNRLTPGLYHIEYANGRVMHLTEITVQ